jgi:hypothetical protein
MIYTTRKGQVSAGEAIGILLLDTSVPFIPGDVANASTYRFPVRFKKVDGFTVARAIGKDPTVFESLLTAARELTAQGVRAITGDCGFMAIHQKKLAAAVDVPDPSEKTGCGGGCAGFSVEPAPDSVCRQPAGR